MPPMAESATQTIPVAASPEHCFDVAVDFERYPEWAKDVKEAVVRSRDEHGRRVEFSLAWAQHALHAGLTTAMRRRCCPGRWSRATSCEPSTAVSLHAR
jgi:hypothetical protein